MRDNDGGTGHVIGDPSRISSGPKLHRRPSRASRTYRPRPLGTRTGKGNSHRRCLPLYKGSKLYGQLWRVVPRYMVGVRYPTGDLMTFKLSRRSKARRFGIDHRLIEISDLAITLTNVDFGIPKDGGVRTADRQRELFAMNVSMCDGKKKKSRHQHGTALDFYAYVDGKASWKPEHLSLVAASFLQAASLLGYKLEWGGLWNDFLDMPHVQLKE